MNRRGFLEGSEMATTFNMLRANDLIWSFVVNNYLLGNEPVPVRPAVLEQRFDPDAGADAQLLSAQDVPGEPAGAAGRDQRSRACRSTFGKITTPAYFLSTREDHITPWKSTYRGTQIC